MVKHFLAHQNEFRIQKIVGQFTKVLGIGKPPPPQIGKSSQIIPYFFLSAYLKQFSSHSLPNVQYLILCLILNLSTASFLEISECLQKIVLGQFHLPVPHSHTEAHLCVLHLFETSVNRASWCTLVPKLYWWIVWNRFPYNSSVNAGKANLWILCWRGHTVQPYILSVTTWLVLILLPWLCHCTGCHKLLLASQQIARIGEDEDVRLVS